MKLNTSLAVYNDVRDVEDPWSSGIIFQVLRRGSQEHEEWLEANARVSKVDAKIAKEWALKIMDADVGTEAEMPDQKAIIRQLLESDELQFEDVLGGEKRKDKRAEAAHLLRGWNEPIELPSGEVYQYPRDVLALLSCRHGVEGEPFLGMSLGDALTNHILAASRANEEYRRKELGADEKNSEASPSSL